MLEKKNKCVYAEPSFKGQFSPRNPDFLTSKGNRNWYEKVPSSRNWGGGGGGKITILAWREENDFWFEATRLRRIGFHCTQYVQK